MEIKRVSLRDFRSTGFLDSEPRFPIDVRLTPMIHRALFGGEEYDHGANVLLRRALQGQHPERDIRHFRLEHSRPNGIDANPQCASGA